MASGRVTSEDVARLAGVSRTTVSYVLNDRADGVPQATQDRVLAAVDELGYVPSASARALRRGSSDLVVWLEPPWTLGEVTGAVLARLNQRVAELGMWLVSTQETNDPERVLAAVSPFAVLSYDKLTPKIVESLRRSGCKHVVSLHEPENMQSVSVGHGRRLAEYLVSRGHKKLGFAGSNDATLDWLSDFRSEGIALAAAAAGLEAPSNRRVGSDPELALAAVRGWRDDGVTAVAAYNDDVALAVIAAARRLGLGCPDDLAVIGVDNTPAGRCSVPSLSSLDVAPAAIADKLASRLAQALGKPVNFGSAPLADSLSIMTRESA